MLSVAVAAIGMDDNIVDDGPTFGLLQGNGCRPRECDAMPAISIKFGRRGSSVAMRGTVDCKIVRYEKRPAGISPAGRFIKGWT